MKRIELKGINLDHNFYTTTYKTTFTNFLYDIVYQQQNKNCRPNSCLSVLSIGGWGGVSRYIQLPGMRYTLQ